MKHILCAMAILTLCIGGALAKRNPDSPFGVVCPWGGLKPLGIKWVRSGAGATSFDWRNHEKQRGVFTWADSDNEINGVGKDEELEYLVLLGYTPEWASSGPKGDSSYPPKELRDWYDYVYALVDHFRDRAKYWEVWNEQDIGFFKGTIDDYVRMLRSAYLAAHKADPNCRVVFGGLAGIDLPFIERAYQLGAGPYFDVMAVHPYQWGPEFDDGWFTVQHEDLRALMTKYGDPHKEIWLTEFGWNTGDTGITQEVQARMLVQSMVTCLSLKRLGVEKLFWFSVKDWGGPGHGILDVDSKPKLSGVAYGVLTRTLTGAKYLGDIPLGEQVRCKVFEQKGIKTKRIAVLWSADKKTHPVKLDLGSVAEITSMLGEKLPAASSVAVAEPNPVYILADALALNSQLKAPQPATVASAKPWPQRKDVWVHLQPPAGTGRAWFARGVQEEAVLVVHNDSDRESSGTLDARIGGARASRCDFRVPAGKEQTLTVKLAVPSKTGLAELRIYGTADGKEMIPLSAPVRVSRGPVIEFLANSAVETPYFHGREPGGAPSVRFGAPWTYRFDLSKAKSTEVELLVGAYLAEPWKVLASSDDKDYVEILSGKSEREWHTANLERFAGGMLYLKFEGQNTQLAELVLSTISKASKSRRTTESD